MTTIERPAAPVQKQQTSIFASGLAMLGAAVMLVATFGIARLASEEGLEQAGIFFVTTAVVSIAGTSTSLGTQLALVYFLPQTLDSENPNPRGLIGVALKPVILLSLLAAACVSVAAGPLGDLLSDNRATDVATVLQILSPTIPAWALTTALLGVSRGMGTVSPTVAIQQVGRPALQILALTTLWLTDRLTPVAVAIGWGIPVVLGAIAALAVVVRMGGFAGSGPSPVSSKEFWGYTRPHALSTSLQIAHERIDQLIIAAVLGTALAGVYGGLSRFATAGNFLAYALTQAISPNLRRLVNSGREAEARELFHFASGWMVITNWPYLLIVATKFIPMALLLNEDYRADASLLTILVVGMIVSAFCGPIELHLLMRGQSRTTLATTALSLATDVVLVLVLASRFGITGAAVAWAISLSLKNLVNSYVSHKRYGITAAARPTYLAATGAVLAILPISLLTPNNFTGLAITLVVGGILTLAFLAINRTGLGLARDTA